MKVVSWLLISSRVLALSCGLTFLLAGCGGGNQTTGTSLSDEETKRNVESKNAMEAR